MHVIVKFSRGTGAAAKRKTVVFLKKHGATGVEPLFPGHPDPDARLMFVAEVATTAAAKKLAAQLNRRHEIEYAEIGPQRRPKKPP